MVERRWKPPHKEKKKMASPPCVGKGCRRRVKRALKRQEDDDPQKNGLKAKPTQEKCVVSGKNIPDFAQIKFPNLVRIFSNPGCPLESKATFSTLGVLSAG